MAETTVNWSSLLALGQTKHTTLSIHTQESFDCCASKPQTPGPPESHFKLFLLCSISNIRTSLISSVQKILIDQSFSTHVYLTISLKDYHTDVWRFLTAEFFRPCLCTIWLVQTIPPTIWQSATGFTTHFEAHNITHNLKHSSQTMTRVSKVNINKREVIYSTIEYGNEVSMSRAVLSKRARVEGFWGQTSVLMKASRRHCFWTQLHQVDIIPIQV